MYSAKPIRVKAHTNRRAPNPTCYFVFIAKSKDPYLDSKKLAMLLQLAARRKYTVVDVIVDSHDSIDADRPFMKMLSRMESLEADGVLTWDAKELTTLPRDAAAINTDVQYGPITAIKYHPERSNRRSLRILTTRCESIKSLRRGHFPVLRITPTDEEITRAMMFSAKPIQDRSTIPYGPSLRSSAN